MSRILPMIPLLLAFAACVRGPLDLGATARYTDTAWLGFSGRIVGSSDLVTDGTVLYFATRRGTLYAVSPEGKNLWKAKLGGPVDATPLVAGERIFIGTADGKLLAREKGTGKPLWQREVGGSVLGRLSLHGGNLLLAGSNDGFLYAFDAATGDPRWRYRHDVPDRITVLGFAGPLSSGDRILAAFSDGTVVALRPADGTEIWSQRLTSSGRFPDVVSPLLAVSGSVLSAQYFGTLFALDPAAGSVRWSLPQGGTAAPLLAAGGRIYASGADSQIEALDERGGRALWTFRAPKPANWSGVALAKGRLLAATHDGQLYVVDPAKGELVWCYELGSPVRGAPVVLGDAVYALTQRGILYRFTFRS